MVGPHDIVARACLLPTAAVSSFLCDKRSYYFRHWMGTTNYSIWQWYIFPLYVWAVVLYMYPSFLHAPSSCILWWKQTFSSSDLSGTLGVSEIFTNVVVISQHSINHAACFTGYYFVYLRAVRPAFMACSPWFEGPTKPTSYFFRIEQRPQSLEKGGGGRELHFDNFWGSIDLHLN